MHELVVNVKDSGCDVYVGRGTKWGNPYYSGSRTENVSDYRIMLEGDPFMLQVAKEELRGKVLGCHCAPKACHADVLAEVANSPSRARA